MFGTPSCLPALFQKGNNFGDFLFASLDDLSHPKWPFSDRIIIIAIQLTYICKAHFYKVSALSKKNWWSHHKTAGNTVWPFSAVLSFHESGAPVAQWLKRWPTDLAVPGSSPARGGSNSNRNQGSIAHSHSFLSAYRPDINEILLKRRQISKSSVHPSILLRVKYLYMYFVYVLQRFKSFIKECITKLYFEQTTAFSFFFSNKDLTQANSLP